MSWLLDASIHGNIYFRSVLNWENKAKSAGAFIGFLLGVWFFEPWMITFGLLFPFIGNIIFLTVTGGWNKEAEDEEEEDDDETGESKGDDGEKKSLKEKMQAMQEIALQIQVDIIVLKQTEKIIISGLTLQKHLGFLAHVLESIKNVFIQLQCSIFVLACFCGHLHSDHRPVLCAAQVRTQSATERLKLQEIVLAEFCFYCGEQISF